MVMAAPVEVIGRHILSKEWLADDDDLPSNIQRVWITQSRKAGRLHRCPVRPLSLL